MSNNKKPGEPLEPERQAQEIRLSQLDDRFICEIDGTVIRNVKDYSFVQYSKGKAFLGLPLAGTAAVASTTLLAPPTTRL